MSAKKVIHQNVDEIVSQGLFSSDGTPRTLSVDHFVDSVASWATDLSSKLDVSGGSLTGPLTVGGKVTIAGDLEVQGSNVIVDAETIHLADNFIVLNSDTTATPQDAGIEVNRGTTNTVRRLWWDETNTRWTVDAYDFQAGKFIGALEGNADTSTIWAAPIKVELVGEVQGDVQVDGSGDVQISTTVDFTTHNHDGAYYTKTAVDNLLNLKADLGHDHNGAYYLKSEVDTKISTFTSDLATKANVADVYTKTDVDGHLANKADVGDSYTKADADALLANKADVGGSYTKADADALLVVKANTADVYSKTDADALLAVKANVADVYTKSEVDNAITNSGFTPAYQVSTDTNGDTVIDFTPSP
jgi:hypothetical protein